MRATVDDIWRAAARAARTPRQLAWAAAYAVLAFGPAALMAFFTPSGTSGLTAGADALGVLGLGILGLQLLLPARWGPLTSSFGTDKLIGLHRWLAGAGRRSCSCTSCCSWSMTRPACGCSSSGRRRPGRA